MVRISKGRVTVGVIVALTSWLFSVAPGLAEAQVLNPLYVQARNWWTKVSAAPLSSDIKAPYGVRFGNLSVEQQALWSLAGQVDSGACRDACVTNYNNRIVAWQNELSRFNSDAENVLHLVPTTGPGVPPTAGGLPPSR